MRNDHNCKAKGLWRNLIFLWHISISLHGYRECLNSACEVEILVGYIKVEKYIQMDLFSPTSFCIHTKRISFALNGKETVSISAQSHRVHRWCIVYKQPRIRKLSGPDVSCWTWDQGEHHFCFLPRFTTVDWEGWSTSHFHLRQTRWFQFPHRKLSFPE